MTSNHKKEWANLSPTCCNWKQIVIKWTLNWRRKQNFQIKGTLKQDWRRNRRWKLWLRRRWRRWPKWREVAVAMRSSGQAPASPTGNRKGYGAAEPNIIVTGSKMGTKTYIRCTGLHSIQAWQVLWVYRKYRKEKEKRNKFLEEKGSKVLGTSQELCLFEEVQQLYVNNDNCLWPNKNNDNGATNRMISCVLLNFNLGY